jgi:hypothetical protein
LVSVICLLTQASFAKKQPLPVSVANALVEIVIAVAEMTVVEMVTAVVVVIAAVVAVVTAVVVVIVALLAVVIAEAVVVQGVVTPKYPTSLRFGQLNHQALRLR